MADYIEREALFHTVEDYASYHPVLTDNELFAMFCSIPAADVRPVVRGKWRERRFSEDVYGAECSICHTTWDAPTNFCPNCGADMRAEEGE